MVTQKIVVACVLMGLGGCVGSTENNPRQTRPPLRAAHLEVQTLVSSTRLTAGEILTARCLILREGLPVDDVAQRVDITPSTSTPRQSSVETLFVPTAPGTYLVRCTAGDDEATDPVGVSVQVSAGPPVQLLASLAATPMRAGQEMPFECVAVDAYGNRTRAKNLRVRAPDVIEVAHGTLQSETVGDYSLSCLADDVGSMTQLQFKVVPGTPHSARAAVNRHAVMAGEDVEVACDVRDAFNNSINDLAVELLVEGARSPGLDLDNATQVQRWQGGFRALAADTYRVRCNVPNVSVQTEAIVAVTPNLPKTWHASWAEAPEGPCFWQGRPLLPLYEVRDGYGNLLDQVQLDMQAVPNEGVQIADNGGLVFTQEGDYEVVATVAGPLASGHEIGPLRQSIRVDSTPPKIEIISPKRGAMLQSGGFGPAMQEIHGVISDPSGLVVAQVNGTPLDIPEGATRLEFRVQQESRWGMTTIDAKATDGCGMPAVLAQSYLRSPSYAPSEAEPTLTARVPQGLLAHVSQSILDDSHRRSINDVASLLESALQTDQLDILMPQHLKAYPDSDGNGEIDRINYGCRKNRRHGWEVTRDGPFTYENPTVDYVQAYDGGWRMAVTLHDLRLPVRVNSYLDWWCAGNTHHSVSATVDAKEMHIELDMQTKLAPDGSHLQATTRDVKTSFAPNEPRFVVNWGALKALHVDSLMQQLTDGVFIRFARDRLALAVQEQLQRQAERGMQLFFDSLRLDHTWDLPAPLKGGLQVTSGLDHLEFVGPEGAGRGTFGLSAQVMPVAEDLIAPPMIDLPTPRMGPIRRDLAEPNLQLAPEQTFAVAVKDDLVNQMLWALWASGSFTVPDLGEAMKAYNPDNTFLEGSRISLFATLPPVLMPSTTPKYVRVGLGDAYIEADIDMAALLGGEPGGSGPSSPPLHVGMYVSALIETEVHIDPRQRLLIDPKGTSHLHMQVVDISDPGYQALATAQLEQRLNSLLPELLSLAFGTLPLPTFQVGRFPGVPQGTVWQLSNATLERPADGAYCTLKGRLESVVPAAPPHKSLHPQ